MIGDNDIERFISGEMPEPEREARAEQLRADQMLPELCADGEALGVLLGDDATNEDLTDEVMANLKQQAHRRPAQTQRRLRPALAAAAAAVLVLGFVVGRLWPRPSAQTSEYLARTGGMISALPDRGDLRDVAEPLGSEWAIFERLEGIETGGMPETYAQIEQDLTGFRELRAKQLLIYRWAEVDPSGAMAYFIQEQSRGELATLFDAWARIDLDAAAAAASGQGDPALPAGLRPVAIDQLLAWSSRHDADGFLMLADLFGNRNPSHWQTAMTTLAAAGRADELDLSKMGKAGRAGAIRGLAEAKIAEGHGAALAWLEGLEGDDATTAFAAVVQGIGKDDPQRAGELLRSRPVANLFEIAFPIVRQLRSSNPSDALSWIQEFSADQPQAKLRRELLRTMVREADGRVFGLYDQLIAAEGPAVFRKDFRIDDLFWQSNGLDYESAIEWAKTLPEGIYGRPHIIPSMAFSWYKHDPDGALDFIAEIEDPGMRARMHSSVIATMVSTSYDHGAAWDFVTQLEPQRHGRDLARVLEHWSQRYPAEAVARLDTLREPEWRARAISRIANNYGTLAPDDAARWAGTLADADEKALAFASIARTWANNDSLRASEWIAGLDPGPGRDAAVESLVETVAPHEADSALIWAGTIRDPEMRLRAASAAIEAWAELDPAAARVAVAESDLPASDQAQLNQLIENHKLEGGDES